MANFDQLLAYGCLRRIVEDKEVHEPVVQVLASKDVTTDGPPRYRFMLSDGLYTYQCCILMGEPVEVLRRGQMDRLAIIKIKRFTCNSVSGKRVIVMLDVEQLHGGSQVGRKIGQPVPYNGPDQEELKPPAHLNAVAPSVGTSGSSYDSNRSWNRDSYNPQNNENVIPSERFNGEKRKKTESGYIAIKPNGNSGNTLNPSMCVPIATLTPYLANKWVIRGRIVSKSNIRTWSNAKGEGKLFSFDMMDDSASIRVTAFKAECDKFYELFQVGDVILLSRGQIKAANKTFSKLDNDYELSLSSDSILELFADDTSCPKISYNFVPINQLESYPAESIVDVAGVITSIGEVQTIMTKSTNRELKKRDLQIADQSEAQVRVTIWGEEAVSFQHAPGTVLIGRALKVSDFGGRSLGPVGGSTIQFDPQMDAVFKLKGWFDRADTSNLRSLSSSGSGGDVQSRLSGTPKPIECLTESAVRDGLTGVTVDGTIVQTGKPVVYKSCLDCNKKVTETTHRTFKCDPCNKDREEFKYRVILKAQVADHTGTTWITLFHQDLENLLNVNFNETGLCTDERTADFDSLIASLNHKRFAMALRCRIETYNERDRVNSVCNAAARYNPIEHGRRLLAALNTH